jgi:hypothetical protein
LLKAYGWLLTTFLSVLLEKPAKGLYASYVRKDLVMHSLTPMVVKPGEKLTYAALRSYFLSRSVPVSEADIEAMREYNILPDDQENQ